jgi:hypothetical protein
MNSIFWPKSHVRLLFIQNHHILSDDKKTLSQDLQWCFRLVCNYRSLSETLISKWQNWLISLICVKSVTAMITFTYRGACSPETFYQTCLIQQCPTVLVHYTKWSDLDIRLEFKSLQVPHCYDNSEGTLVTRDTNFCITYTEICEESYMLKNMWWDEELCVHMSQL